MERLGGRLLDLIFEDRRFERLGQGMRGPGRPSTLEGKSW